MFNCILLFIMSWRGKLNKVMNEVNMKIVFSIQCYVKEEKFQIFKIDFDYYKKNRKFDIDITHYIGT